MKLTQAAWDDYISRLSRLNQKAGQLMREYMDGHPEADTDALIRYAYALVTKYGEGSAELACQMYDALAGAQGVTLPAAEPAATASYGEVSGMVKATQDSPPSLQQGVSRMVKQAGADTTTRNAIRDGAEWAWVPHGDACPFCRMLASNGWQRASKNLLKKGHAQHIHANCDCEFAVRFSREFDVSGYDPEKYLKQYRAAGSDVNAMRRIDYAARKDVINAQKRAAYAVRKGSTESERSYSGGVGSNKTDLDYINSEPYRAKFDSVSDNPALNQSIYKYCKAAVTHQSGDYYEDLSILRIDGSLYAQTSGRVENTTYYPEDLKLKVLKEKPYSLVSVHNHGTNVPPSGADFGSSGEKRYAFGIVACHDGTVYKYSTRNARPFASNFIDIKVDIYSKPPYNMGVIEAFQCALRDAQDAYGIEWSELK